MVFDPLILLLETVNSSYWLTLSLYTFPSIINRLNCTQFNKLLIDGKKNTNFNIKGSCLLSSTRLNV